MTLISWLWYDNNTCAASIWTVHTGRKVMTSSDMRTRHVQACSCYYRMNIYTVQELSSPTPSLTGSKLRKTPRHAIALLSHCPHEVRSYHTRMTVQNVLHDDLALRLW